jgi:hypothetical protein
MTTHTWTTLVLAIAVFVGGGFCIAASFWWDDK